MGINTFALWRLGSEDRSLWNVWDQPGEASAPDKLKDVPPGQDVDMEEAGEILQIEERPSPGQRTITVDPNDGAHFSGGFHQATDALSHRAVWSLG